jgi:predicted dehydrogenase
MRLLSNLHKEVRRRRLEIGEAGLGKPAPQPARLSGLSASKKFQVAVIGAGAQGLAQCQGMLNVNGIEIAGLAEVNPERLKRAESLRLPSHTYFDDANRMLKETAPLDLICVATTAPLHVKLGRLALSYGVKCILLEKPIDTSLGQARAFAEECRAAGVRLVVNYSRRWSLDYQAIKRCITKNFIGDVKSVSVLVGKGELAMHASHYFDLCRYLFASEPTWVTGRLEPLTDVNPRGAEYYDPSGFCLFGFQNGARAFFDFSSDMRVKDPFLTIKGSLGRISVDEQRMFWTLQSRSQRVWSIPFSEPINASILFSRVAADLLSNGFAGASGEDGVAALEMVVAVYLSNQRGSQNVTLPLSTEEGEIGINFP